MSPFTKINASISPFSRWEKVPVGRMRESIMLPFTQIKVLFFPFFRREKVPAGRMRALFIVAACQAPSLTLTQPFPGGRGIFQQIKDLGI